jgi:peptidoglycan/LPS O-acetylase OafA/YrhL
MNKGFDELDSIRGLAAVSVMFSHFLIIFPVITASPSARQPAWLDILKYSPLHIWFAGTQAVGAVSSVAYRVIEVPSMVLGKRLTSRRSEAGGVRGIEVEGAGGLGTAP